MNYLIPLHWNHPIQCAIITSSLNNFAYSKAVDGNGELSNSRIRTFFRHSDVSLKAIYEEKQEKASGGYYSVATLSSAYDGKQNKAAKVVVNLSGIRTNLTNNMYLSAVRKRRISATRDETTTAS